MQDAGCSWIAWLSHVLHRHFIWLLIGSYALAAVCPAFGLWIRSVSFGEIACGSETARLSLPVLLLALLLVNAGLGMQAARLRELTRNPAALFAGVTGNVLVPIAFIAVISRSMHLWHNPSEVQNVLVGLALVAAMPIAGSSTAWCQNANGDVALSLGLVLCSTLISPITTPLTLHSVAFVATADCSKGLHGLAASGTGVFLTLAVLAPSLFGMAGRAVLGEPRIVMTRPFIRLGNSINLLLLNYSNASLSLPQVLADPDWDFLTLILAVAITLCIVCFASGSLIATLFKRDRTERISLMFGLGMNNNGTGLVLASLMLAEHPRVLLPIISYNLVQHLVAGAVDFILTLERR